MSYSCKILLDSISETGKRLTTFEITFPRCVLAEAETHRVFSGFDGNIEELIIKNVGINVDKSLSRNSASSRAIPINKMIQKVRENPFIPEKWGKPAVGMGAKEYYKAGSLEDMELTRQWDILRNHAIAFCERNQSIGNKEDLNRILEPFMWHTALITATEFNNFFKLRTNSAADWKIRKIADLMYEAYHKIHSINCNLVPTQGEGECDCYVKDLPKINMLKIGEWHCPLVSEEDESLIDSYIETPGNINQNIEYYPQYLEIKKRISVARCARVSYLTHDGKRDIEKDLELFERLRTSGHWSPFEHVATPYFDVDYARRPKNSQSVLNRRTDANIDGDIWSGNFLGFKQYRKEFQDENCTNFRKEFS